MPMSEISSDILAFSFDGLSSPQIALKFRDGPQRGDHTLGWGLGWYPNDSRAAIVVKDPSARDTSALRQATEDWDSFRSTVFFCKVRGAARGYTHLETQPFMRAFAAQDWLFMHNGDLDKSRLAALHTHRSIFLEPLGRTDSELAFCYLLGRLSESGARTLSEIDHAELLAWFKALDALGSSDMMISDGKTICAFYGTSSQSRLFYRRLTPPHTGPGWQGEAADFSLNHPRDTYRTAFVISSEPFDETDWTPFAPGQLMIVRMGAMVWTNHPDEDIKASAAPALPTTNPPVSHRPPSSARAFADQQIQMQQLAPAASEPLAQRLVLNARGLSQAPDGSALTYRVYDVCHSTQYDYAAPVEHSTHQFRLAPVEDPLQEVISSTLTISVEGQVMKFEDVFGNSALHYAITRPYTSLKLVAQSRVRLYGAPPDDLTSLLRQHYLPLAMMPWQKRMMDPYLTALEMPETQITELLSYAMSFAERNSRYVLDTLNDINQTIFREYAYVQGVTSLSTTPFDIYAGRRGVCQDFANLFICLARLLGLPARYRVGYVFMGSLSFNSAQAEASHAWAEVYIPYLGWRGFDPTNGCTVGKDHVRLACGRHYVDATPTSGTIFKGGGNETLTVNVSMTEAFL